MYNYFNKGLFYYLLKKEEQETHNWGPTLSRDVGTPSVCWEEYQKCSDTGCNAERIVAQHYHTLGEVDNGVFTYEGCTRCFLPKDRWGEPPEHEHVWSQTFNRVIGTPSVCTEDYHVCTICGEEEVVGTHKHGPVVELFDGDYYEGCKTCKLEYELWESQ